MGVLRRVLILIIVLVSFTQVKSQISETIEAFSTSYTYETNGEYAKAIQEVRGVYNEADYSINLRLGWLNYMNGDFTLAISYYKKAIKIMPYSVEARLGLVYPAYAMGNLNMVEITYKNIIEIDAKNYTANYKISSIYYGKKMYKEAFQHMQIIVNLYPFDYNTTILFAWINLKLNKTKEAKVLFNKALMLSPNDVSAIEGLGVIE